MNDLIQRLELFKKRTGYLPGKVGVFLNFYYDDGATLPQVEMVVDKAVHMFSKIPECGCAGITDKEKAFLDEFKK